MNMVDDEYLFDEDDRSLFTSKDLDLKAKALRYHLMPRLEALLRQAMTLVREIYSVDPMEFSTISRSPGFRTDRRKGDVTYDYEWCSVGLCGVRKPIWSNVRRAKDGKNPVVLYVTWQLELTSAGLFATISTPSGIPLSPASYDQLMAPLIHAAGSIAELISRSDMRIFTSADDHRMLRPLTGRFKDVSVSKAPEVFFASKQLDWPITDDEGANRALALAELFPIYDAWLRAAQGLDDRMPQLLGKLEEYWGRPEEENEEVPNDIEKRTALDIASLAIERTIALPAKRYQVFQRDGWKCVSCGKNPVEHEIILHVDHIIPRSKGGTDTLENYQTLCDLCNLGKSNRDDTDIRAQHRK